MHTLLNLSPASPLQQVPRGINMSLDDLIKEQRQSQPQHRRGQGRGFGVQVLATFCWQLACTLAFDMW